MDLAIDIADGDALFIVDFDIQHLTWRKTSN
jgi:hypothetical protein